MSNHKQEGIFCHISKIKLSILFLSAVIFSGITSYQIPLVTAQTVPVFDAFEIKEGAPGGFCETTPQVPALLNELSSNDLFQGKKSLAEIPQDIAIPDPVTVLEVATEEDLQTQVEPPATPEQPAIAPEPEVIQKPVIKPAPKVSPAKPKIVPKRITSAPKPYVYKKNSQGQLVCATKNDKPHKSSKTNKVHMDMECCLDPDEIPNPHCYYPPSKYGKLLSKLNR